MSETQWIKTEAETWQYSEEPVTALLQITLYPQEEEKDKEERLQLLSKTLEHQLSQPVNMGGHSFNLRWYRNPQASGVPVHYLSRTGYTDLIKAVVMKYFFTQFNQSLTEKRLGRVEFLLTKPFDYLAQFQL